MGAMGAMGDHGDDGHHGCHRSQARQSLNPMVVDALIKSRGGDGAG